MNVGLHKIDLSIFTFSTIMPVALFSMFPSAIRTNSTSMLTMEDWKKGTLCLYHLTLELEGETKLVVIRKLKNCTKKLNPN
jgi:hypothetical protein